MRASQLSSMILSIFRNIYGERLSLHQFYEIANKDAPFLSKLFSKGQGAEMQGMVSPYTKSW